MTQVEERLAAAGHELHDPPAPAANYVPWVRTGSTIYVSGQIPVVCGEIKATGMVGDGGHSLEEAQGIAQICALNAISVLKEAAADAGKTLDDLRILRLSGFVNVVPGFTDIHLVTNGASDLMALAFGKEGVHARSAVGMAELPLGVPFELEVIAEIQ
ncbi:MAG: RidA family protein [Thermoplasmatota archaeon]